jgi:ribosome-binding protein aMBF1 (putative translation factor)
MITNERQYILAKTQAEKFEQTIDHLEAHPEENAPLSPLLAQAERAALTSQLETLRREIHDYEQLRAGERRTFQVNTFEELPEVLIQARVARGLTQKDLAERLGLKEQQIQRYEATHYASASLTRVRQVIEALHLSVREEVSLT